MTFYNLVHVRKAFKLILLKFSFIPFQFSLEFFFSISSLFGIWRKIAVTESKRFMLWLYIYIIIFTTFIRHLFHILFFCSVWEMGSNLRRPVWTSRCDCHLSRTRISNGSSGRCFSFVFWRWQWALSHRWTPVSWEWDFHSRMWIRGLGRARLRSRRGKVYFFTDIFFLFWELILTIWKWIYFG